MVSCSMRYSAAFVSVTSLGILAVSCGWSCVVLRASDLADDGFPDGAALREPVARAHDSQRTCGDGFADDLGALEQLADRVLEVLTADLGRIRFGLVLVLVVHGANGGHDLLDEGVDVRRQRS